jgi:hypothetical protein
VDENNANLKAALEGVDENKRAALIRLLGGGFATPIVASFAMSGLTVDALAQSSNGTGSGVRAVSDRQLKTGIVRVGTDPSGVGLYRFRYLWGDIEHVGVMAQEVREVMPHAVKCRDDGFLSVDYAAFGAEMLPYAVWSARTDQAQSAATP